MKKLFAKLGAASMLSVVFLVGGLLFCATGLHAQALHGAQSIIKSPGTWETVDNATQKLQNQVSLLNQTLQNPNYPNSTRIKAELVVYMGILNNLGNGYSVPDAAVNGYFLYAPSDPQTSANSGVPGLGTSDWNIIFNDMLTTLKI